MTISKQRLIELSRKAHVSKGSKSNIEISITAKELRTFIASYLDQERRKNDNKSR